MISWSNHYNILETEVKQLTSENKDLQQRVSLLEKDEVTTFENGRYTNDVREVIMELFNLDVSISKINLVITAVLTKLGSENFFKLRQKVEEDTRLVYVKLRLEMLQLQ